MVYILQFVGGLVLLFLGGRYLVKGGVEFASHFRISTLVVGVTVVSFGTSAPELLVSLKAAVTSHPDISIGNVIGSNIANIALVLALTGIIYPIAVKRNTVVYDWPFMMASSILFYLLILNFELGFWEGLSFVLLLIVFNYWTIRKSRRDQKKSDEPLQPSKVSIWLSLLMIVLSSLALVYGADFLVTGTEHIALRLGVSERVISTSIVAFGTSVPELATSLAAAVKKELDISIGNIIGSNIFNILGILGITALVQPISINPRVLDFDIFWMLGISLLLFFFIIPVNRGVLTRWKGVILFLIYILYIYLIYIQK